MISDTTFALRKFQSLKYLLINPWVNDEECSDIDIHILHGSYLENEKLFETQQHQTEFFTPSSSREDIRTFVELALLKKEFHRQNTDIKESNYEGNSSCDSTYFYGEEDIDLEQNIIKEFAVIKDITMIYLEKSLSKYVFKIILNLDSYDDKIMDLLLDHEYEIMDKYSNLKINFHYIPYLKNERLNGIILKNAKLIFQG